MLRTKYEQEEVWRVYVEGLCGVSIRFAAICSFECLW